MKLGLIIIDVQNDYFEGGQMALENTSQTLANIITVKEFFERNHLPIYLVQHINDAESAFFRKGSFGAEIHADLFPIATSNHLIVKQFPNSFLNTDLENKLKQENVDKVVIVGMMTHMCVDSTTRAAKELGYEPILISDGCTTRSLNFNSKMVSMDDVQTAFFSALSSFSEVMTVTDFLDAN